MYRLCSVKTLFLWLALVIIGIGAALYFGRSRVQTGAADRPWPLGLGVTVDAPKRFPATKDNAPATKLLELAAKADVDLKQNGERWSRDDDREALVAYLQVQLERSGDTIDAPPSDVAKYLTKNAAALDEIRALVLGGEPIVFESDPKRSGREAPGPYLPALQHLHRTFVVRALDAARTGNAAAWDELRVTWELARPLWRQPGTLNVLTASTAARMVNAAARKMPLPPPAWLQEVFTFDYERTLVATQQLEAWRSEAPGAMSVRLRGMAEAVLRVKACDSESPQFTAVREELGARATPQLVGMWARLMRFRAEREATQRVLQIRAGQAPSGDSQCSDGSWQVTPTSFRFTRDVPAQRPQIKYPLEYAKGSG